MIVGKTVGKMTTRMGTKTAEIPAKIAAKQVFDVDGERLGIGVYDRPLLDTEMRRFRAAWDKCLMEGVAATEVSPQRISFVAAPGSVPAAWDKIDSLLAAATGKAPRARKVA